MVREANRQSPHVGTTVIEVCAANGKQRLPAVRSTKGLDPKAANVKVINIQLA